MLKALFGHRSRQSAGSTTTTPLRPSSTLKRPQTNAQPQPPQFNPKVRWWNDEHWLAQFDRHIQGDGFNGFHPHRILDRRFTLSQFARTVRSLPGSTAECGVYRGIGSAIICETLRATYRQGERHYGFDSFEGLPQTGANDAAWKRGDLADPIVTAEKHLRDFPFVQLVKGWLPDSLQATGSDSFRLVHIDVDIERTTRDCLIYFYPRVVSGGLIFIDDYGFHSCPGARQSTDAFLRDKPETLIELTTGQAVFYKH